MQQTKVVYGAEMVETKKEDGDFFDFSIDITSKKTIRQSIKKQAKIASRKIGIPANEIEKELTMQMKDYL